MTRLTIDDIRRETISVEEASRILGVGRNQAYALARAGKLPVIRNGRRFLVPVRALRRWLETAGLSSPSQDARGQ